MDYEMRGSGTGRWDSRELGNSFSNTSLYTTVQLHRPKDYKLSRQIARIRTIKVQSSALCMDCCRRLW